MFRLKFLGTSSGIATKARNVSALAIECVKNPHTKKSPWILVDCGDGTHRQILKSDLSLSHLTAICITHTHGDHCYGLLGLLSALTLMGHKKPLTLIAPKAIGKLLDTATLVSELQFSYPIEFLAIEELSDTDINNANTVHSFVFSKCHQVHISIGALSHRCPSYAFGFVQEIQKTHLNMTTTQNQHSNNKHILTQTTTTKLVVSGDNDTPRLLTNMVQNSHALVHEATYTDQIRQKILNRPNGFNPQHSSAKIVAEFAETVNLPILILTHFSARYSPNEDTYSKYPNMYEFRQEVNQYYQGKVILAKDFLSIEIEGEVSDNSKQIVDHQ